ncbi:ImmA/IrrE family metallo-endopeptidase [Curtobacterium sp. BRB10]|uniref:ImmA/IrrE family metallo-endopeptidase n=1 Tax=Curtobacterium sp. BRB10 TaxID=2962579 RepID=UPI002881C74E|nr:ImmA/IrrE family metallo-endopeptidase [Curtobacterium sp. BRB10]MDT0235373.1 ImmA/IrrE family metallo-endopeptidase [Curtobacterium sp. BRB10]
MPALPVDQIRRHATGALRAAGLGPHSVLPIPLADVATAAGLHRQSLYDLGGEEEVPPALRGIFKKMKATVLGALSIPERRVFIDDTQTTARARFTEAHEIGHDALPWHHDAYYGDDRFTLDPASEAGMEAEANQFAADVIFALDRFTEQADSSRPSIDVPLSLNSEYQVSAQAAVRRYAETSRHPVAVLVVGRYLSNGTPASVPIFQVHQSPAFTQRYGPVQQALGVRRLSTLLYPDLRRLSVDHPAHVDETTMMLTTNRGKVHFRAEGFTNGHVGMVLLTRKQPTLGRPVQLVDLQGRPLH